MKRLLFALLFVHFTEGHVREEFEQLSYSKLRALYAEHYDAYKEFVRKHKKGVIDERPEPLRLLAYAKTVEETNHHNELYEHGKKPTFKLGLNKMVDTAIEESERTNNNEMRNDNGINLQKLTDYDPDLPKIVDWVKDGYVTSVKNNSCIAASRALAVAGTLEALHKARTGELITLSAQELLDCRIWNCSDTSSDISELYEYVIQKGGLQKEETYPWTGQKQKCRKDRGNVTRYGAILSYLEIPILNGRVDSLKAAIARGPVAVRVYFYTPAFQDYKDGKDFGEDWCENGYIYLSSNPVERNVVPLSGAVLPF